MLATGCHYNGGNPDDVNSVILNAWKQFQSLKIPRIDGGGVLGYYDTYTTTNDQTSTLLRSSDGMCIAWSKFLIDVLEAQGIHQTNWNFAINTTPDPTNKAQWLILVKAWQFDAAGPQLAIPTTADTRLLYGDFAGRKFYLNTYTQSSPTNSRPWVGANQFMWTSAQVTQDTTAKNNVPGQGQPTPASLFNGHNVVEIKYTTPDGKQMDQLFDPSYGATYNNDKGQGLKEIQANAIAGYAAQVPVTLDANNQFDAKAFAQFIAQLKANQKTNVPLSFLFIKPGDPLAPQLERVQLTPAEQDY